MLALYTKYFVKENFQIYGSLRFSLSSLQAAEADDGSDEEEEFGAADTYANYKPAKRTYTAGRVCVCLRVCGVHVLVNQLKSLSVSHLMLPVCATFVLGS